jgi:hypothetical protein
MVLGAILPILFRALHRAKSAFSLSKFFTENQFRFYHEGLILLIVQSLLFFEGQAIVKSLAVFGAAVPIGASSVIGFGISWLVIKTIPKRIAA